MRWNQLGLMIGLAGALASTRTFALSQKPLVPGTLKMQKTDDQLKLDQDLIEAIKYDSRNGVTYDDIPRNVIVLLEKGADPNARVVAPKAGSSQRLFGPLPSEVGRTALRVALDRVINGRKIARKILKVLIAKGADVSVKDEYGRTLLVTLFEPIPRAEQMRGTFIYFIDRQCCLDLIDAGSDVNARDEDGTTVLMLAANWGFPEVMQALIAKGADVNAHAPKGLTPLYYCNRIDTAKVLLDHGADFNSNTSDMSLLRSAAASGNLALTSYFVSRGASINPPSCHVKTPLMAASESDLTEMMQWLLDYHANINATDEQGWSALIWAASEGREQAVRFLLHHGARVDISTNDGKTLLQTVREMPFAQGAILRMVKQAAAKKGVYNNRAPSLDLYLWDDWLGRVVR